MAQISLDSALGGGETLVCRLTPSGRIDTDTKLEIKTDEEALIIRPMREGRRSRVQRSAERLMDQHDDTLRKLAE